MVRAPCCEKMGLKKGPWTPEEDRILINYIRLYGHGNWRALPKQAGLLRCGKSCRLRWTNYLRPDIKRGNFSREEEETIIQLHEMLGNRWSAIAARLPGRTDNEIKNVWHTHLKKRLKQYQATKEMKNVELSKCEANTITETEPINFPTQSRIDNPGYVQQSSPQESSSNVSSRTDSSSSIVTGQSHDMGTKEDYTVSSENFFEIDETFWTDIDTSGYFPTDPQLQSPLSPVCMTYSSSNVGDGLDFWYNLLVEAGELPKI